MTSLIDFVNRVRTIRELPEIPWLSTHGAEPDSPDACLLAKALETPIVVGDDVDLDEPFWMLFEDRAVARTVGVVMHLPWCAEPPMVRLPWEISDVAVAFHFGFIEIDDVGLLAGWYMPEDDATDKLTFFSPTGPLLKEAPWHTGSRSSPELVTG